MYVFEFTYHLFEDFFGQRILHSKHTNITIYLITAYNDHQVMANHFPPKL